MWIGCFLLLPAIHGLKQIIQLLGPQCTICRDLIKFLILEPAVTDIDPSIAEYPLVFRNDTLPQPERFMVPHEAQVGIEGLKQSYRGVPVKPFTLCHRLPKIRQCPFLNIAQMGLDHCAEERHSPENVLKIDFAGMEDNAEFMLEIHPGLFD